MEALAWFGIVMLVVLVEATMVVAYARASYAATLTNERNAWWLRGCVGRRLGTLVLSGLMQLGRVAGQSHFAATMRDVALAKAAALEAEPPAKNSVCFIGSSTFTYWTNLARDIAAADPSLGASCFNAAFGGSCTTHLLAHIDALCTQWKPRVVVYFCGTNDLNFAFPDASDPLDGFAAFLQELRAASPSTPVVYLAATVTPFVEERGFEVVARYTAHNNAVAAFCAAQGAVEFVPSAPFQGQLLYYLGDNHHLNAAGHAALGALLAPAVRRAVEHADQLAGLAS